MLNLETARLVQSAYEHFGRGRFSLRELAERSGEDLRVLQGLTGSLGVACRRRGVAVFRRHDGEPQLLSVRPEVAEILAAEGPAPADV